MKVDAAAGVWVGMEASQHMEEQFEKAEMFKHA